MRKLLAATLLALALLTPARPANAQFQVTGVYNGSWTTCYYVFFCFDMRWQYITYADGTFNYNDSTGYSYTGWY